MYRCLFVSLALHLGLLMTVMVMGFITPPVKKIERSGVITLMTGAGGGGGGGNGNAGKGGPLEVAKAEPVPTPPPTPRPAPTQPAIATPAATPRLTPMPRPTDVVRTPVPVQNTPEPVKTAIPKPVATPPPAPTAPPKVIHRKDETKKVVKETKKEPIVEAEPTPKPTATPQPTATPGERQVADAGPLPELPAATPAVPLPEPGADAPPVLPEPGNENPAPKTQRGPVSISAGDGSAGPGGGGEGAGGGGLGFTYLAQVEMILRSHFKPPYYRSGVQCRVRFTIMKDGTIANIEKLPPGTGNPSLDQYAIKALTETAKLPPLYDDFNAPSLTVTVTFDYEQK